MKSRKIFILFIVILMTATAALSQDKAQKVDELMKSYYDYGQFNGTVLVAEKGKVIYKKGFGMANMEWAIPNQPDTKFRIGSVTKQFTATLILQLVDEGKNQINFSKLPKGLYLLKLQTEFGVQSQKLVLE